MASIIGKKQKGKVYYYLTESARVNGKPRIVSQQYLGSAEEIAERLSESGPGEPDRTQHVAFGDIAAVWGVLERLGVVGIIDEVVGLAPLRRGVVGGHLPCTRLLEPGGSTVLEAGLLGLVVDHLR